MIVFSTLQFLGNLAENNYREWFHACRNDYDAARKNVIDVASMLLSEINKFDKLGFYDVRKSLFRIARDTRFSHDKSPYKTNFGVLFNSDGSTRSELSGYYMHIEPNRCFISCGLYMPAPDVLKAVRTAIYEDFETFTEIICKKTFKQTFGDLVHDEDALFRVPQGFNKNTPSAVYLKLKHFYVMTPMTNEDVMSADFIQKAAGIYRQMKPLNDFLNKAVKNM